MSAGVKDKSLNSYTIYLCMYLCKVCVCVCDERGRGVNVGLIFSGQKTPEIYSYFLYHLTIPI